MKLFVLVACPSFVLGLGYLAVRSSAQDICPPRDAPGQWSAEATDLSSKNDKAPEEIRDLRICSPDHKKAVRIVKNRWWVEIGEKRISLGQQQSTVTYPAELAWSPDSTSFFITQSWGYSTGYWTEVYKMENGKIRRLPDINRMIRREFERRHPCISDLSDAKDGDAPNVAALTWMGSSDQLLMIAELPPVGLCGKHMEYFGGYSVSISRRDITERFSPQELDDRWSNVLGERLRSNLHYLSAEDKATVP